MKGYKRYFCHIRVDVTKSNIVDMSALNKRIENLLEEWSQENADNGISTDIGWSWSELINLD